MAATSPVKCLLRRSREKRRNATPSTMCGIISGDSRSREHRVAPPEAVAAIARAAGHRQHDATSVAETVASAG